MSAQKKQKRLNKELKLRDVYAMATGGTLSAGLFLLPGIAAVDAGPALVLAYFIAALALVPAMYSIIELATAMPRAGGVYYFLDRSLGPFWGTIGGIGTWLALLLKVAFALVGMGAYIALFLPTLRVGPIAVTIALVLGILALFGAKKSGGLQILLLLGLLPILGLFVLTGAPQMNPGHFSGFFDSGFESILATAGLVFLSYGGITKVTSLSEEIKDPEKNLPRGVILALLTALGVYVLGTAVIVGLVPPEELRGNLTSTATAAGYSLGRPGVILLSIAALFAFISVANAGLLSASRYPLAMSRDHLLPPIFRRLSASGTPVNAILVTVGTVVAIIVLFDPMRIAKLASAFQLLMFALVCMAVIVMRESQIQSYDPGYRSPFYPWMQILGILVPLYLISLMGLFSILFSAGLMLLSALWFWHYARHRMDRAGAIYHVFERLGRRRYHGLDPELRGILKEKGLRAEDPFDEIISRALVLDQQEPCSFESLVGVVAHRLPGFIPLTSEEITEKVMEGTRIGATPVSHGVALPHFRTNRIDRAEMVLVRNLKGVRMALYDPLSHEEKERIVVRAVFFLISPERDPAQHLRILARVAERVDEESFATQWRNARNEHELKESLLHDDQVFSLVIGQDPASLSLSGKLLREAELPQGCLVAMLSRGGLTFVPNGNTPLQYGDRLTVIGEEKGLTELRQRYPAD